MAVIVLKRRCLMSNKEQVNHPSHYKVGNAPECIELVRWMNFNLGNVVKYCYRNGLKDGNSAIQDLKKARFYLDDEIKRLEQLEGSKK